MIDQFHSKHALANTLNQLQPQKLSTNVWLGPLNSIAQNDFLSTNNIKYIFGIMPSQKCCYYLKNFTNDSSCCVSIDPNFNTQKLTEDEGELIMNFNTKFSNSVSFVSDKRINNAIITNLDFQKMLEDFLYLIRSIQEKDSQCGILLFSLNGNDNLLSTFAMSYIMDSHNCDVTSGFSYLKSVRPSIIDFDEYGFYASELLKFQMNNRARKQFGGSNNASTPGSAEKAKRSVADALDDEDQEYHDNSRSAKRIIT
ncbi:hypothetical protein WICANDRAFT_62317 [Wickerhamomyces anomalus NRRL Y-366-8]|uniref:Tyrosine-protein phosphatase domain-containing protein n=1 Tax=Wickerhamomyces anomalus (strain ATCC 58044 / CBS 1984 / NCYC 433 / NRRL Y-366-8) TaxID=683960 RepID=A0A1E3P2N6_WICAA|nr:uncharacterized protein WICANDRAFT_62317 [Wickerhamomyces anomalus NRRL Y-366-8]ODQ59731.1 hypothetical protein WICANDRAFT_62317 [Wickerhamomyces anomalus NRRL Y-366-8]